MKNKVCEIGTRTVSRGMSPATAYHFYVAGRCLYCFEKQPFRFWWRR